MVISTSIPASLPRVAKALLDAGADLTDEAPRVAVAMELDPEKFGNPALKTQVVARPPPWSRRSPTVREVLVNFQGNSPPIPPGAVLDGRDVGTVICPHSRS